MNARILPWAAFAAAVAALAVLAASQGETVPPSAGMRNSAGNGLEIRLGAVEMREFHDDGSWNMLVAERAVYSYGRRIVEGFDVVVSLGTDNGAGGDVIRAPRASWDFDGKSISMPDGARASREGGWEGELTPAALDLAARVLRVPGEASLAGPGVRIAGKNLIWRWPDGELTMDSPVSRIAPAAIPERKG